MNVSVWGFLSLVFLLNYQYFIFSKTARKEFDVEPLPEVADLKIQIEKKEKEILQILQEIDKIDLALVEKQKKIQQSLEVEKKMDLEYDAEMKKLMQEFHKALATICTKIEEYRESIKVTKNTLTHYNNRIAIANGIIEMQNSLKRDFM